MNIEMVDIYFSIPRELLMDPSDETKQVFYRFMDDIFKRIHSIYNSKNLKKMVLHSPQMITNTDCAICLEPIRLYSTIHILHCRHGFHVDCIKELTDNHHYQCPICRTPLQ